MSERLGNFLRFAGPAEMGIGIGDVGGARSGAEGVSLAAAVSSCFVRLGGFFLGPRCALDWAVLCGWELVFGGLEACRG